ncbi:T9SS type A sorting domain-containing protein [Flavobacterium sp. CYK-4]|uniref:3-coathanger stack domain-containing protein n=1 Tax=Flavobacterium lotistagni TaxID=2709660 RepID=UPI001408F83A|nr:3-coathanger stack domain-containing protein [Flavobacterium lotistagni]NHM05677.1 T9SS type A sorting domain-containing protein [Flavobacterium lotistagni]
MRKLILALILGCISSWAQNQNNHWQLGVSDIDFTTNPPVVGTVSNSGQYGNATISDVNGNLLFYTNGITVWNKNHAVMTNGGALVPLSINNVMIVPNPANSNQYYIFRAIQYNTLGSTSTCMYTYSIVEFNTANPLGILLNINTFPDNSITTNYSLRLKDASGSEFSNAYSFSPITVAKNAANDGYWVIVQSIYKVLSYKLDTTGFSVVPVESTFTNAQIYDPAVNLANPGYGGFDLRGRVESVFKMSPNNAKLGGLITTSRQNAPSYTSSFYTLNFNSATGQFSNFVEVHSENTITIPKMVQEFEFSANSDNVYLVRFPFYLNNPGSPLGEIIVKNLSNIAAAARTLNEFGNTSSFPANFNYIQRDKYNNIWLSSTYTTNNRNFYLHKIDSQDSYSNSSVILNSVSLNAHPISEMPQPIPTITSACPNTLVITQNVSSGSDNRQAANTIEASNSISGTTSLAIYHGGNSVLLKPSFSVTGGARFHAYIAGCTGTFLARNQQNELAETDYEQTGREIPVKHIEVFPNPNDGVFRVSLNNISQGLISIADFYGRMVFKAKVNDQKEIEINLQNQPKGIYLMKIETPNGLFTEKVIKN